MIAIVFNPVIMFELGVGDTNMCYFNYKSSKEITVNGVDKPVG